jgi:hypothetical protein
VFFPSSGRMVGYPYLGLVSGSPTRGPGQDQHKASAGNQNCCNPLLHINHLHVRSLGDLISVGDHDWRRGEKS